MNRVGIVYSVRCTVNKVSWDLTHMYTSSLGIISLVWFICLFSNQELFKTSMYSAVI